MDILRAIRVYFGDDFSLRDPNNFIRAPLRRPHDSWKFWFEINGETVNFFFKQFDFGVKFVGSNPERSFLSEVFIDESQFPPGTVGEQWSEKIMASNCAQETNRCFFLHLGFAIGLHPMAFEIGIDL